MKFDFMIVKISITIVGVKGTKRHQHGHDG